MLHPWIEPTRDFGTKFYNSRIVPVFTIVFWILGSIMYAFAYVRMLALLAKYVAGTVHIFRFFVSHIWNSRTDSLAQSLILGLPVIMHNSIVFKF